MEHCALFMEFLKLYKFKRQLDKQKSRRRWGVHPVNANKNRDGYYERVFKNIKYSDAEDFVAQTRMSPELFEMLLNLIKGKLIKRKQSIGAQERLSITLLFLAHGHSMQTLASKNKIGKSTVRNIVLETCEVLWSVLSPLYLDPPNEERYREIAVDFEKMWNFPNCVGAIDAKHIAMNCPRSADSQFLNNKRLFSMVLMAACDAKYTFTAVSVAAYDSESVGEIFQVSECGKALFDGTLPLPPDLPLPNMSAPIPHVFVADTAFPLKQNLMRPFPERMLDHKMLVYNYRLGRARSTIEKAFSILAARWRILLTRLEFEPANCEKVVLACVLLHNFLMMHEKQRWHCPLSLDETEHWYCPLSLDDTESSDGWRSEVEKAAGKLPSVSATFDRRISQIALLIRDSFADYFLNEGSVSFQPQETSDEI